MVIPMEFRGYNPAPSASQPTAQTQKLSKIWRKAGDSNAYVPWDPGLADQWDTSYPSLPGKANLIYWETYRLNERHQERPTVSRYDSRPRLNKCRIVNLSYNEKLLLVNSLACPLHAPSRAVNRKGAVPQKPVTILPRAALFYCERKKRSSG